MRSTKRKAVDYLAKRLVILQMLDHLLNSEKCKNMYRLSKEEFDLLKEKCSRSYSIVNIIKKYFMEKQYYEVCNGTN